MTKRLSGEAKIWAEMTDMVVRIKALEEAIGLTPESAEILAKLEAQHGAASRPAAAPDGR
ncbi:hypothetical protein ABIE65_002007 [Constrictibacter sp. MBR-5]|uniref:hypothetical protein n=1 Tax=Constrictibacter sp. MBR-5 TaxID=3156467 RepID=UPI003394A3E3